MLYFRNEGGEMKGQNWRKTASQRRRLPKLNRNPRVHTDNQIIRLGARMLARFLNREEGAAARDLLRACEMTILMVRNERGSVYASYEEYLLTGSGVVKETYIRLVPGPDPLYSRVHVPDDEFETIMRYMIDRSKNRLYPIRVIEFIRGTLDAFVKKPATDPAA
jgi:hypothetical protein